MRRRWRRPLGSGGRGERRGRAVGPRPRGASRRASAGQRSFSGEPPRRLRGWGFSGAAPAAAGSPRKVSPVPPLRRAGAGQRRGGGRPWPKAGPACPGGAENRGGGPAVRRWQGCFGPPGFARRPCALSRFPFGTFLPDPPEEDERSHRADGSNLRERGECWR